MKICGSFSFIWSNSMAPPMALLATSQLALIVNARALFAQIDPGR
jgi:hypothetical protein